MRKDKGGNGGTIVNISSIGCMCQHAPALFVYMGTKSAVLQFSNCIGVSASSVIQLLSFKNKVKVIYNLKI